MSAVISPCGNYRYWLGRDGDKTKKTVAFIMLNPSTANGDIDDATIRRCRTFAKGAPFVVVNLYAYRATNPKDMQNAIDPFGPDNWLWLVHVAGHDFTIICAWGANAEKRHADAVCSVLQGMGAVLLCLGTTKDGHPRHPLYVKSDAPIVPWVRP